jgi:hypothetical protein
MFSRFFKTKNKSSVVDGDVIYTTSLSTDNKDMFNKVKEHISRVAGVGIVNVTTYEHNDRYDPIYKMIVNTTSETKHKQITAILTAYAKD